MSLNANKAPMGTGERQRSETRLASKSTYYIDQVRTNYGKFNIHFSGPSVWNNMAENLKTCSSLHLFKHMLKADILSTYS